MVLDFISYTISRSEFFEKIYAKSRSENTVQTANYPYKLKQFFKRQVLPFTNPFFGGLKKEMGTICSPTKVLRYFGEFVEWMQYGFSQQLQEWRRGSISIPLNIE